LTAFHDDNYFALTCVLCTVDIHVDVGSDLTSQCIVVFLPSVSSAPAHSAVCCPHTQDAVSGKNLFSDEFSVSFSLHFTG